MGAVTIWHGTDTDLKQLQEALEKWVGRKVSIIIEDVTE